LSFIIFHVIYVWQSDRNYLDMFWINTESFYENFWVSWRLFDENMNIFKKII
jgi:hypothetical protein